MTRLTLIVAATLTNGIGKNGTLPWRLPQEMAYFAKATSSAPEGKANAVVMGRNTWESIPPKFRPLPKRSNFVISRNKDYELLPAGSAPATLVRLYPDIQSTLTGISEEAAGDKPIHRTFIIGGASLYGETLALSPTQAAFVDRILLTRVVHPLFEDCDVHMPDFQGAAMMEDGRVWKQASHEELQEWLGFDVAEGIQEEKGVQYEFQMWVR